MNQEFLSLAELAADSIEKEGYDRDDIYNEAVQAILEVESSDVADIVTNINRRITNLKPIKKEEALEGLCYNEAEYNLLKDEVLEIFEEQDKKILALMIEGYTPLEISEKLEIRESLVNIKIYYIRKKVKDEYCD